MTRRERKTLHAGRWLELVEVDGWEFVDRSGITGIVVVVPVTKQGEVVLIEQYRPPLDVRVIEFPAGLAGDEPEAQDETLEDAARRELLEETGYAGETLELLTKGPPSPGLCTEVLTFFLATDVEKVEKGGGVEGEDIDVHAVPVGEVEDWLHAREAEGRAVDPKVYTGLFFIERSRSGPRDPG